MAAQQLRMSDANDLSQELASFQSELERLQTLPKRVNATPEDVEQGYCDVFLDLLGMEMVPESEAPTGTRYRSYYVRLSPDARAAWEGFCSRWSWARHASGWAGSGRRSSRSV